MTSCSFPDLLSWPELEDEMQASQFLRHESCPVSLNTWLVCHTCPIFRGKAASKEIDFTEAICTSFLARLFSFGVLCQCFLCSIQGIRYQYKSVNMQSVRTMKMKILIINGILCMQLFSLWSEPGDNVHCYFGNVISCSLVRYTVICVVLWVGDEVNFLS